MELPTAVSLLTFALVMSITPGPNNVMLASVGLQHGFRKGVPGLFGVTLGNCIQITLAGLGLAALLRAYPHIYLTLQCFGLAYLCYFSYKIFTANKQEKEASSIPGFWMMMAFQWINPKALSMAFMTSVIFIPPIAPLYLIFVVAAIFGSVNLPSCAAWLLMGDRLGNYLQKGNNFRYFNGAAGSLMALTTAWLAWGIFISN